MPRYAVHIDETPETSIIEEDLQIALERIGQDRERDDFFVDEVNEGEHFIVETDRPLNARAFLAALERLDGAQTCKASVEYLGERAYK
mgnify:FL=1